MRSYIIRRLLWMIPTIIGITLVSFLVIQLAPGDPVRFASGVEGSLKADEVSKKILEEQRELLGLDKPLWQRYPIWLSKIVRLDFGKSFKDFRPVKEILAERVPITLQINILAIFVAYVVSIPLGVHSAVRAGRVSERVTTLMLFVLYSLPSFWVAYILIFFLAGGDFLDILPVGGLASPGVETMSMWGRIVDRLWHFVLPVTCLTYGGLAGLSRYMRAGMIEILRQDYIRTARAKGLTENVVIFKHAMRNSVIPIITILAGLLPGLIGGSVIIETIFDIPGMGQLGYTALLSRDYPVIMAVLTISAVLTLLGILLADIAYALVDPRIKYD